MPEAPTTTSSLARCGQCGYWLHGLPVAGQCPECGAAYDGSTIILLGWATGRHSTPLTSRGNAVLATYFFWIAWVGWPVISRLLRALPTVTLETVFVFVALVLPNLTILLLRLLPIHKETTRCDLSPLGVRQDTFGRSRFLSQCAYPLMILPVVAGNSLGNQWLSPWHAFLTTIATAVPFAVIFFFSGRARLKAMRTMQPWCEIAAVKLQRKAKDRSVLTLTVKPDHIRNLGLREAICAEFILSDEQFTELGAHLQQLHARTPDSAPVQAWRIARIGRPLGRCAGLLRKSLRRHR